MTLEPGNDDGDESKAAIALRKARSARRGATTWIQLHNILFGIGGELTRLFSTHEERTEFTQSAEYKEINQMISQLRESEQQDVTIVGSVATVQVPLPQSLRAALVAEAAEEGVSLEQLCTAKLTLPLRARG